MKIAERVEMLELQGPNGLVHPTLVWDDKDVILIDCGFPGQIDQIEEALSRVGLQLSQITHLIFTHQDMDHIGTVNEIKTAVPDVKIYAHEVEKPYMDGTQTPIRIANMEANFDVLPADQQAFLPEFKAAFENRKMQIDVALKDGDVLPFAGGIVVIHTPGHTPGHMALYLQESKVLVAGDSLKADAGRLEKPSSHFTIDMKTAIESVKRYLPLAIHSVVCYHGGACQEHLQVDLESIARSL